MRHGIHLRQVHQSLIFPPSRRYFLLLYEKTTPAQHPICPHCRHLRVYRRRSLFPFQPFMGYCMGKKDIRHPSDPDSNPRIPCLHVKKTITACSQRTVCRYCYWYSILICETPGSPPGSERLQQHPQYPSSFFRGNCVQKEYCAPPPWYGVRPT